MFAALLWLMLACAPALGAVPQSESHESSSIGDCKQCGNTGEVKCNTCAKSTCSWQGDQRVDSGPRTKIVEARFCSKSVECRQCLGTRVVACPFCKRGLSATTTKLRAENEAWIGQMRTIDEAVGSKPLHVESLHFSVTWGITDDIVYQKRGAPPHSYVHNYLDLLELIYADCLHDFSATDKDFCGKTSVMLWQKVEEQERASLAFTGKFSPSESMRLGKSPVISILYDSKQMQCEAGLSHAVVHDVAHCLLASVFDGLSPGELNGGWMECGLAAAYENRYCGWIEHYCPLELSPSDAHQFGDWEYSVVKGLLAAKETRFVDVIERKTGELSPEAQTYAWSYCDYMLRSQSAKFGAIVKGLKAQEPCTDLLKRVLDMTPEQFQESWSAWVKAKYRRSGQRG